MQKSQVAQDLELLADFVAHVGVLWMEFGQRIAARVNIRQGKVRRSDGPDYIQNVEGPSAFLNRKFFEWTQTPVISTNISRRAWIAGLN